MGGRCRLVPKCLREYLLALLKMGDLWTFIAHIQTDVGKFIQVSKVRVYNYHCIGNETLRPISRDLIDINYCSNLPKYALESR